jgi:[NiFe] hydrogenase diaphorase moiety large subunit
VAAVPDLQSSPGPDSLESGSVDALLLSVRHDPHALVQILRAAQARHTWLSRDLLGYIAGALGLTLAHVEGVATFYRFLHTSPAGEYRVLFSDNITDRMQGNVALLDDLCRRLGVERGCARMVESASISGPARASAIRGRPC